MGRSAGQASERITKMKFDTVLRAACGSYYKMAKDSTWKRHIQATKFMLWLLHYDEQLRSEREKTIDQLRDIRDLLRTGTPPTGTYTFEQWPQHKCDRAAGELTRLIEKMENRHD
jgi:hypothetical protein